ncbi:MAG: (2Fe-2S)-binding protein [Phycisphaerales bacterium]
MGPDDNVCLCFKVPLRKLCAFIDRERPQVASQLSDCLGAGTGCHWCVPFLEKLHEEWRKGAPMEISMDAAEYAARRGRFKATGVREPAPPDPC